MAINKKPITLEEFLRQKSNPEATIDRRTLLQDKYKRILEQARGNESDEELIDKYNISVGKFSLRTKIRNNPWLKTGRPATQATKWFHREVLKSPDKYRYNRLLMAAGNLYTFEYLNPKYKGTAQLPWFDKYPLVLSLGPVVTKQGIRNLGFNLHIVPPKVRIVIICQVFELFKRLYRYQIFFNKPKSVNIKYTVILKALRKYGVDFCVRMYIPRRQRVIVHFPYQEWHKAIFLPSRGYDGIKAWKLIQAWTKHIRKLGYGTRSNLNWDSHI